MRNDRIALLLGSSLVTRLPTNFLLHTLLLLSLATATAHAASVGTQQQQQQQEQQVENYAVIVSSSRYWFNYRHAVNALTIYQLLRTQGNFTNDRIILMLADEYAVNPRNPYQNFMTSSAAITTATNQQHSLYDGQDIEIDYRGEDVTVENLARVLSGRSPAATGMPVIPAHVQQVNLFLYLTGHGGDGFFKFQDVEEILAADLGALLRQRAFRNVLFIADTCQAFTLGEKMQDLQNVVVVGSSLRDESSYAHHSNAQLGLAMIERYTYALEQYLIKNSKNNNVFAQKLHDALVAPYSYESQRAHIGIQQLGSNNETAVLGDYLVNRQAAPSVPQLWSSKALWTTSDTFTNTPLVPALARRTERKTSMGDAVTPLDDTPSDEALGTGVGVTMTMMMMLCTLSIVSLALQRRSTLKEKTD